MPDKWTIKRLIDWTTDHFSKHQIEDPHLEAEILLANALGTERIKLYMDFEKEVAERELKIFKDHIQRRIKREPTAYITGYQPFMSLNFKVNRDVLIPRPETELLVEDVIRTAKTINKKARLLDIGTGSGAIAVTIAKFIENIDIVATDSSAKALGIAKENAIAHNVQSKIEFVNADIFPLEASAFDIIVSNPPYIRTDDIKSLQSEVRDYEPVQALDGGRDGLDSFRKIMERIHDFIRQGSYLFFEIGIGQSEQVMDLVNIKFNPASCEVKKDLSGVERIVKVLI